jgi:MarR family transcriptional regulator for hemolysin
MITIMSVPSDDPAFDFVRECVLLSRKWRARVDEALRPTGLTLARSTVLYWVDEIGEGATQRELADIMGIEGPTLVRLLHALEAQGLIERVPMPGDRRAKGIRLTEAARPMLDTLMRVTHEVIRQNLGKLDRRRLSSATRLAQEARTALSR